jgi:hypothetical protein
MTELQQEQYPMTVHLGVLTATRPIGARVAFSSEAGIRYEGILTGLTKPSEHAVLSYVIRLRTSDGIAEIRLPLSHPITLLTGREGRPEDGHTFRITVINRGSSGIMGPGDSEPHDYQDSPEFGPLELHAEVRAWSQSEALERASKLELRDWRLPSGVSLWHAREADL